MLVNKIDEDCSYRIICNDYSFSNYSVTLSNSKTHSQLCTRSQLFVLDKHDILLVKKAQKKLPMWLNEKMFWNRF